MKLVKEAYRLLSLDAFKSLLLIFQITAFVVLFNICVGTVITAKSLSNKVENSGLFNCYYYSYGIENPLAVVDESKNVRFFDSFSASLNKNDNLTVFSYPADYLRESNLRLKNGGVCRELGKNNCLISYDVYKKTGMKKGDILNIQYGEENISLKIQGVLHYDEQINKFSASGAEGLTLKLLYEKPKNTVIFTESDNFKSSNSTKLKCGIFENSKNLSDKQVKELFESDGEIHSFSEMLLEEKTENKSIVSFFAAFTVVLMLITMINVSSNNFLALRFCEKRFGIYYLCGMTFSMISVILVIRSLIMLGLSYVLSVGIIMLIRHFATVDEFAFSIPIILVSFGFVLIFILLSNLPLYIKMRHTAPIQFFNGGLE